MSELFRNARPQRRTRRFALPGILLPGVRPWRRSVLSGLARQVSSAVRARIMRRLIPTLLLILPMLTMANAGFAQELTIGVRAHLGHDESITRWQATADLLSEQVEGYTFSLVPYTGVDEMAAAALNGEIDYAITNPSSYVVMEVDAGANKLVSLVNEWQGQPLNRFGSVIFMRKAQADVLSLQDLRGKSMMGVAERAFGGWQMVLKEFRELNIDPEKFLGSISFSGGIQQDVVYAVRDGRVDAGVVRTGVLEKMAAEGLINFGDFQVVGQHQVAGFPLLLSTDLYPEWVFAELPGAPEELSHNIRQTLVSVESQSVAATRGGYVGWQDPVNYRGVHLLLQELKAAPYENFGALLFQETLWHFRYWILVTTAIIAALLLTLLFAARRNAQLSQVRGEILKYQESELNFRTLALDEHSIVSTMDGQGNITHVNDKFVEISGYSEKELLGKNHWTFVQGDHATEFFDDLWQTISSGKTWTGEIKNRRKDGTNYWVQSTIVPYLGENGKPFKFISLRTDITETKVAHANLQLKQFFDLTQDEVYMFWPDTMKIFYANRVAQEVAGLSEAELLDMSPVDISEGLDETRFRKSLQTMVDGLRDSISYEVNRPLPNGETRPSEIRIQYVKPEGLKPRYIATVRDISERKAAEEEVRQLKSTLDHIADEVYMFWPDTKKFFYVNQAAKDRIGLPESEIFKMTPTDLEGGLTEAQCRLVLNPMIKGDETSASFVRETPGRDGSLIWTESTIQLVKPEGKRPRFIAVLRDVTERTAAQEEIRQLSSSLDLIQNEVYVFWPESYEFIYLNQSARDRVGWSADEWRGKKTYDNISPMQQARLEETCKSLVDGAEKSVVFETVDRNNVPLEIYLHLVEPIGEKPRFLAVYRDITEQKKADVAKTEFISTVSHELRTPLTSIKGALALTLGGAMGELPEKTRTLLSTAHKNCDRLVLLVNDILDLSRIESGKMDFEMEDVDLSLLVADAITANKAYGEEYEVTFSASGTEEPVLITGNPGRLMQVMDNLMSNAAKFSNPGGTVEISLERQGPTTRISVKDHGVGIPDEQRSVIFDRFVQGDSSDKRQKGGTGLGLNIAKTIIEKHGGSICFRSEVGSGTTFFIDLPAGVSTLQKEVPGVRRTAGLEATG